jgi:hypothetical protein
MFILAWLVMLILQANHLVIPHIVSLIVGIGAIVETCFYAICILIAVVGIILAVRK